MNDRDSGAAERVVDEIVRSGGVAVPDSGDVSTVDGAEGVVARAVETFGGLDILLNACQPDCDRPLVETTAEDFERAVRLTLKGAFMPTRSASVQFRQQRSGRVVTLTSNAGLGDSGRAASAAASEGIVGMTRTVARDLGRYGVTCNAIAVSGTSGMTVLKAPRPWREPFAWMPPRTSTGSSSASTEGTCGRTPIP